MPTVRFTANLRRHVECEAQVVCGSTVREALDAVFAENPRLRGYVLNDQGGVHNHVAVMVNGVSTLDRSELATPVEREDIIDVLQALSGG